MKRVLENLMNVAGLYLQSEFMNSSAISYFKGKMAGYMELMHCHMPLNISAYPIIDGCILHNVKCINDEKYPGQFTSYLQGKVTAYEEIKILIRINNNTPNVINELMSAKVWIDEEEKRN